MEYIGGILIRSNLSLSDLQDYYSQYSNLNIYIEKQTSNNIEFIEHDIVSFKAKIEGNDYFIIYSWGDSSDSAFSEFDLRGHWLIITISIRFLFLEYTFVIKANLILYYTYFGLYHTFKTSYDSIFIGMKKIIYCKIPLNYKKYFV